MTSSGAPIEFEGVVKTFGDRTVLDDLTFSVPEGTVVGLLGPNGAGKSTAMRVLLGLHHATAGQARVFGKTSRDRGFREAVRQVGTIIEAPPVYKSISPMHNLAIRIAATGRSMNDAEVRAIINRVGLAERADDPVKEFSLGMRQRMGLALALVGDPKIVVLDEPTNGLDPEGAVEVRNLIRELPRRGATALVCTHRLAEIEATCDYVVVLQQGRLIQQGTLDEIRAMSRVAGHRIEVPDGQTDRAVEILRGLDLGDVTLVDGAISTASTSPDPSLITETLAHEGIYLQALSTKKASLEEAFLELTGSAEAQEATS